MYEDFFRERLRFFRNEKGVSAREMSLALGQNESYINKIENDQREVSMPVFFNICEYLQVTPSTFFSNSINNVEDVNHVLSGFQKLTSEQAKHILYIIESLNKG